MSVPGFPIPNIWVNSGLVNRIADRVRIFVDGQIIVCWAKYTFVACIHALSIELAQNHWTTLTRAGLGETNRQLNENDGSLCTIWWGYVCFVQCTPNNRTAAHTHTHWNRSVRCGRLFVQNIQHFVEVWVYMVNICREALLLIHIDTHIGDGYYTY